MSQEEMDAVLDKLEQDLDQGSDSQEMDESLEAKAGEDNQSSNESDDNESSQDNDNPDGFITYEDWIEMGKDPRKFRGQDAFEDHGKTLNEVKELKRMLEAVVESTDEWKASQRRQEDERVNAAIEETRRELEKAREEEDIDAALAAKDKLTELEKKPASASNETPELNPGIVDFIKKHPILDSEKAEYDQDFYSDMSQYQQTILEEMTGSNQDRIAQLTPRQIERTMALAYDKTKALYPEKFKSKRNNRQGTPAPQQRRAQHAPNPKDKLKGFGRNSMNHRDTSPADDIYEMIKAKNPEIAERFLNNITQE